MNDLPSVCVLSCGDEPLVAHYFSPNHRFGGGARTGLHPDGGPPVLAAFDADLSAEIEEASCLTQIERVEPLVEPLVNLRDEIARHVSLAVGALQAGQADRGAQLE